MQMQMEMKMEMLNGHTTADADLRTWTVDTGHEHFWLIEFKFPSNEAHLTCALDTERKCFGGPRIL